MTAPKTKSQKSTQTVIEQCIAYLRRCTKPKTAAQIAAAIGRPAPSVRRTLNQNRLLNFRVASGEWLVLGESELGGWHLV